MKRMVSGPPVSSRSRASPRISRIRGTPSVTALKGTNTRSVELATRWARVVLPLRGGPRKSWTLECRARWHPAAASPVRAGGPAPRTHPATPDAFAPPAAESLGHRQTEIPASLASAYAPRRLSRVTLPSRLQPSRQEPFRHEESHRSAKERQRGQPTSLRLKLGDQVGCGDVQGHPCRQGETMLRQRLNGIGEQHDQ